MGNKIKGAAAAVGIGILLWLLGRRHKPAPEPGAFTCPVCGEAFMTQEDLNQHVRSMHSTEISLVAPPLSWQTTRILDLGAVYSVWHVVAGYTCGWNPGAPGIVTISISLDGMNLTPVGQAQGVGFTYLTTELELNGQLARFFYISTSAPPYMDYATIKAQVTPAL